MPGTSRAPVDLFVKMHTALVAKNYKNALDYCNTILSYEQENVTMKSFHELLSKKLEINEETDYTDTSSASSSSESDGD